MIDSFVEKKIENNTNSSLFFLLLLYCMITTIKLINNFDIKNTKVNITNMYRKTFYFLVMFFTFQKIKRLNGLACTDACFTKLLT